ncbi:DctP family TRAP transporter solute-binding subunit [Streptomyces sp. WAC 00631]|uniref:DctP family TRAP transporter solute-binding subunit n=1 Tax=unclassified Streptomyces TaxID=2593676 RepID=UPI000F7AF808|nr:MULTISPECIES: DctP family TRAP transporter solute-binding subunit [unclassified Streptomyces]MCC5033074.1 DctP family TRAP transporter solute-binding subunit [Streptomyces sp. WAC 00631]MCC9741156.1 DctP family TRAP transporter solute-binding subunit [Streptomyces sp. MNU89]
MPNTTHRTRTLAVLSAAAVLATGCTAVGGSGGEGGDTVTLSFANSYATGHPHTRCGIRAVADDVNGRDIGVEMETFPNSELGDDSSRFTSLTAGDIDMDVQGSSALAETYAPVGVLDMAYAFDGPDHLFEFFDSPTGDKLKEDFTAETGARILDVWYFGMRHFSANKAIRKPADLDGQRIRFPDSKIYLENAKALGADATAVAFEEVYLSLQQGVVDGQENPIPTIAEKSFDEVQSHVSLSGHQTGSQLIVINEERWQKLSGEQRKALQKAVSDARPENRACIEKDEAGILGEWADEGSVTVVDDVDRDAFSERAEKYFTGSLSGEQRRLYDAVRASAG